MALPVEGRQIERGSGPRGRRLACGSASREPPERARRPLEGARREAAFARELHGVPRHRRVRHDLRSRVGPFRRSRERGQAGRGVREPRFLPRASHAPVGLREAARDMPRRGARRVHRSSARLQAQAPEDSKRRRRKLSTARRKVRGSRHIRPVQRTASAGTGKGRRADARTRRRNPIGAHRVRQNRDRGVPHLAPSAADARHRAALRARFPMGRKAVRVP